jgi:hypothetical protein
MNKRIREKLTKKTRLKQEYMPKSAAGVGDGPVKELALECWRIKKLIPEFVGNRKHLVLQTSVDKMIETLATLGVEIDDPEGSEFRDGMTLDVALFDKSDKLEAGQRIVSETLSPTVYINNKLAATARVIVSVGTRIDQHGT